MLESDLWTPSRLVIIEFPDTPAAQAFVDDPDYAHVRAVRHVAAACTLAMVEGA